MTDPDSRDPITLPSAQRGVLRTVRLILWVSVALAAGVGLYLFLNPPQEVLDERSANYADTVGGPFSLTAPDGSTVTDRTLAGKPFAIFFGFTRCPDVCPTTLSRMAQLRKRMGPNGDKFRIAFVSVDPGHDSPEDIGRYVELFGTPILGLTGSEEDIARVTKAYHAYYRKVPVEGGDYTIDHTAAVYLMDARGKLQSILDFHESPEASLAKLERLVS